MRIVVVTTSFPRHDDDPSGHFVRSSALRLARDGNEVHVITPGGAPSDPPARAGGLILHRAGGGELFGWPGVLARAREKPWRVLLTAPFAAGVRARLASIGSFDRAIAHWIIPSAWPLLPASPAPLEVVAHGADVRLLLAAPAAFRRHVLVSLLDRGARFVFAARGSLDALSSALGPRTGSRLFTSSRVKPPEIDVPDVRARAAELRASVELAPGQQLAVVACRLIASKRVDLAIEAAALAHPSARLVVVGDGPEKAALERLAARVPGPIVFTGALHRKEALAWISAADVLVHTSALEAAPTAVREARALGVRVVACDAGDLSAWAHDDAGIAIAGSTPGEIAAAVTAGRARRGA